jgi:exonuclease SbcC
MWIKRAVFKNFGRHEFLEVDFVQGLNGIFGVNGGGKSTVTDGIFAAISNEWGRFHGVKTDNIRDLAHEKAESSIYIEAESLGVGWTLHRGLRPNKSELLIEGRTKGIHKANEIQHALEEDLGVNMKLLEKYVFVPQWSMFSFLSETAGDRAKTFQHLCGTGKAEEICQAIVKLLEAEDFPTDVVDNTDEIRARLATERGELEVAEDEAARARKKLLSADREAKAKRIIAKRKEFDRLTEEVRALAEEEEQAEKTAKTEAAKLKSRQELVNDLADALGELRPGADTARAQLSQLDQFAQAADRKAKQEKRLAAMRDPVAPEKPDGYLESEEERNHRDATIIGNTAEVAKIKGIIRQFGDTGVAECSLCGTKTGEIPVEEYRNALPVIEGTLRKLVSEQERDKRWALAFADYHSERQARDKRRKELEEDIAALSAIDAVDVAPEELLLAVQDFEEQEANLEQARKLASKATRLSVRADTSLEELQKRIAENKAAQLKNVVKDVNVEKATKALDKHTAARVEVAKFDERVLGLQSEVDDDEKLLAKMEAQLQRQMKAIKFAKMLRGVRKVMHRQNLPKDVAQENLEDMEDDINEVLEHFGNPFWVEASDDLSFDVHFPGEPTRPAARLSGGQKVMLAVAFRAAVSSLFSDEVGMMCLDEPAAGLDEANVDFLAEALKRFGAEVRGKRQVIMVTHANSLRPSFDQVIEVGGA